MRYIESELRPFLCSIVLACVMSISMPALAESANKPAHHTETGFKNLYIEPIEKGPFGYIKMKYFGDDDFADHASVADQMPIASPRYELIKAPSNKPQVTWLGHSTFLIQYQGINVLTDPMLSERASPVSFAGPKRLVPMPVSYEHLPEIDFIVISHNHYDHLDVESLEMLESLSGDALVLVPLRLKEWFESAGLASERVVEFDWWDEANISGLRAVATPSQHWSARGFFDRYETLWAAWYLEIAGFSVWFGGDTGYNDVQFKEIGAEFTSIDLGLIPIGAYAPRWFMAQQHVDPDQAIQIHDDINAKQSVGMHWGTFELSAEPMMEPAQKLREAEADGRLERDEFVTMKIGETKVIDLQ